MRPGKEGRRYDEKEVSNLWNRCDFMEPIPFGLQRPVKAPLTGVRENARTLAELYGNSIDKCPGAPRKKGRCGECEEPRATWDA